MLDNMMFNDIYSVETFMEAANDLMRSIERVDISEDDATDIVDSLFVILNDYLKSSPKAEDIKNMLEEINGLIERKNLNDVVRRINSRFTDSAVNIYDSIMNLFKLDHIADSDRNIKSELHDICAKLYGYDRNIAQFCWVTLIANYNILGLIMDNKYKRNKFIENLSEKTNSSINFQANYSIMLYGINRIRNAIVRKFEERTEIHYMLNLLIIFSIVVFKAVENK